MLSVSFLFGKDAMCRNNLPHQPYKQMNLPVYELYNESCASQLCIFSPLSCTIRLSSVSVDCVSASSFPYTARSRK